MEPKSDDLTERNVIEILKCSLADKQLPSSHDTQNEVRYKLIIDPSEDESITRLFFIFGILKRENTRTYICSDFVGDGQLQKVKQKPVVVMCTIIYQLMAMVFIEAALR